MAFAKKLDVGDLFLFIKDFRNSEWNTKKTYPAIGFLAGYFQVSGVLIKTKLEQLEKIGKVEIEKSPKYNVKYKILQ